MSTHSALSSLVARMPKADAGVEDLRVLAVESARDASTELEWLGLDAGEG